MFLEFVQDLDTEIRSNPSYDVIVRTGWYSCIMVNGKYDDRSSEGGYEYDNSD